MEKKKKKQVRADGVTALHLSSEAGHVGGPGGGCGLSGGRTSKEGFCHSKCTTFRTRTIVIVCSCLFPKDKTTETLVLYVVKEGCCGVKRSEMLGRGW